jgi:hypothetical protein
MATFNVRKSLVVAAPVERVYETVRDFSKWTPWSPWLLAEPECQPKLSADGRGYSWSGEVVGAGENLIIAEDPPEVIRYRLIFLKPWKSVADVSFNFKRRGGNTEVTWSMQSSLPFFLFWMRSMMAAFIGMDYERGLLMLKDYLETGTVPSRLDFLGPTTSPPRHYLGLRNAGSIAGIGERLRHDFTRLRGWMQANGCEPAGKRFSLYHRFNCVKGTTACTAACPITRPVPRVPSGFIVGEIPEMKVYTIRHTGAYRHLGNVWAAGSMHERAKRFHQIKKLPPFEIYENEPELTDEADLETIVCFPMR